MKKLLLVLSSLSLSAFPITSVISCGSNQKSDSWLDFPSADYHYLTQMYKSEIETYLISKGLNTLSQKYIIISDDNDEEQEFNFLNYNFLSQVDEKTDFDKLLLSDLSKIININDIRENIIRDINSKIDYRLIKPDRENTQINFSVDGTAIEKKTDSFLVTFNLFFSFNYLEESGLGEKTDWIEFDESIVVFNSEGKTTADALSKQYAKTLSSLNKADLVFKSDVTNPRFWSDNFHSGLKSDFKTKLDAVNENFIFTTNPFNYNSLSQRLVHSKTQRAELRAILKGGEASGKKLKEFYEKMGAESEGKNQLFGFDNFKKNVSQKFGTLFDEKSWSPKEDETIAFGRMNVSNVIVSAGSDQFVLPEMSTIFSQEAKSTNYQENLLEAVANFFNALFSKKSESDNVFMLINKPESIELSKNYSYDELFGAILGSSDCQEAIKELDKFGIQPSFNLNQMSLKNHGSFYVDDKGNIYATEKNKIISEINWGLRLFLSTDFNSANSISLVQDYVPKKGQDSQFKFLI
ncbi:hypothetical protein [Spiroplasma endosymbiont of Panorpa germanica]|uniref:hypothetical protein n=1 Tax=Spiroplasma endosymbiont of Panorpa germanica TaxID=3066314 RepID=UPI0030CBE985